MARKARKTKEPLIEKRVRAAVDPLTPWEYTCFLLPRLQSEGIHIPIWPPDVFAICASLLGRFGAYAAVLANWPRCDESVEDWAEQAKRLGTLWRETWADTKGAPQEIGDRWLLAVTHLKNCKNLKENLELCQLLLELLAIADEACAGLGLATRGELDAAEQQFYDKADALLTPDHDGSSACDEVHPTRVRVLPKMHSPKSGLTLRSLSHNLSLCASTEMVPKWHIIPYPDQECLNLLVIPWPKKIYPVQFSEDSRLATEMKNMPQKEFGFFKFSHSEGERLDLELVENLLHNARSTGGDIQGVVLPELALSPTEHERLAKLVVEDNEIFLIAGVGSPGEENLHCKNEVLFSIPGIETLRQSKHHRWLLDQAQLNQYGLGSRLHPEQFWWEHISVESREITFVALLPWLALVCLICEDLARPDPVGDLVRSVGPNLVVALLMDGPQLRGRWPGRYAMSLADDPGCSVLSVTSLGMSELSRPQDESVGSKKSRVVALWKDAKGSSPVEIELPDSSEGIVLSITERFFEEWTADGRSDDKSTGYPALTGIHAVAASPKIGASSKKKRSKM